MEGFDFWTYDRKLLFNVFTMQAGETVPVHKHGYPHDIFIVKGSIKAAIGPIIKELHAPDTIHFPGGADHSITAITDAQLIGTHDGTQVLA